MRDKKKLLTGVIGYDIHFGGNIILQLALRQAGFDVISLGTQVTQKEFIDAAMETRCDAILVSSMYGMGEIDCQGFSAALEEAGFNIPLYIGGNLAVGREQLDISKRPEIEGKFKQMGFTRVYPNPVDLEQVIKDLKADLHMGN
ncbi:methylaspartate mutase subunit S [Chloroflexota bacterium]